MATTDPLVTINGKLNLNANVRITGDEIKCWAPTQHGDGVYRIVLSADDCSDIGKAFSDLAKNLKKTKSKSTLKTQNKTEAVFSEGEKPEADVSVSKKTKKQKVK